MPGHIRPTKLWTFVTRQWLKYLVQGRGKGCELEWTLCAEDSAEHKVNFRGILGKTNACVPHTRGPQYNICLLKHLYHPAVGLPYPSNCTLSQSALVTALTSQIGTPLRLHFRSLLV